MTDSEQLVGTPEAAKALGGVAPSTLDAWAYEGTGPPYCKIGSARKYKRSDLNEWLQSGERTL